MGKRERKNGQTGRRSIAVIERQKKVMRDYLDLTFITQDELAAKYGTCQATISNDLATCRQKLREEAKEEGLDDLDVCLKRNDRNLARAVQAWERSQENDEEIRTSYEKKKCSECEGTGMTGERKEEWCDVCDGVGETVEEVVSRRVRGQAGDPRFLGVVNDCIRERCRLKGYYPEKRARRHEHLHLHADLGKEWENAPPDLVLEARRLTLRLTALKEEGNGEG